MWEEALICMCVYLGVFFILPDTIRRPFTSKRYMLWTIGFGVALVLLSAYGLHKLTRRAEKFQVQTDSVCSGVKCPSTCLFRASLSASGSLSGISYLSGYENCLITGMDISGVHVSGSVRVESVSQTSAQLDTSKTYNATGSNLLSGSTNPVCYANTRALRSADQDQTIGFNLYGRYVRIYAPKDETVCEFTATLNTTGGLSIITVTKGSLAPGMYIFGTSQANGVSLSNYNATAKTAQLDSSKTYTAGSLNLTAKLSDGSFGLSQVMVYNAKGDNIASGRPTTGTTSTYSGGGTASSVIDGTTIPRAAPNAMDGNRAWGNVNTLGRDNDYWEVDLGTRQMIPTIRIISPNDYGDTRNVSGGGGNRVKGLRISVLESATETPSLNGKCAASPLIIYPVLTTGTQITDEEKKVVGPEILNGIDGEKVLRIHRLLNERYPTVQISDLRSYLSDEQIVRLYKTIENGNNVKDSTDGFITPANLQALRNLVKQVRSITDIPTTTVASTPTEPAIRNFPDAVTKFMTARVVIMKRIKNSANGSPMMDSSGRPIIEDVSDRGIPAALIKLVEPLKPVSQNNSSLGYSSGAISGSAVDGSAYSEENNVPADLASGGAAVENRPVPTATTNPDGSIRIAETGALSDIDAYLLQSGYQAPTGNLSKALPQWYLSIGPFSYNNAVLKCAEGGDKLITLAQLRAAQAAGARYNVAGWVKDVTDRVYTIQDTPATYAMVRAPLEGCPAGTTGGPTGCSVTQAPVPVTGCPTGTTASSTGCSAVLTARNFDCPAGLTATTTGCNPLQLVTTNRTCPTGTTASPTGCATAPLTSINHCPAGTTASPTGCATAPLTSINRSNCPAGTTASPTGCSTPVTYGNCPANYVAATAIMCIPATTTRTNMTRQRYFRSSSPADFNNSTWTFSCPAGTTDSGMSTCIRNCLAGETTIDSQWCERCPSAQPVLNVNGTCSSACPAGYSALTPTTCTFIGAPIDRSPICPAGTTRSGNICTAPGTCSGQIIGTTCYPSCPANTTIAGTTCTAPGTCSGQIIAGACYPSCPANTTTSGTTCTAPGTCTGGQVIAGVCYPSCPANTTISGTTCTAPGTCAGRRGAANTCYPSCPANTSANGANCESAGECRKTNIAGGCYYPCETGETMSGTTCTGAIVTVSAPPAAGASAHCYGMKESFWPSARSIIASWTNRDISIPDGQIAPLPSVGSAPNQDPGGPIDIANTYKADDWNKRSKNDPLKNKEVFHVSSRYIYTKAEAQAVCQSIGADLATFDQMTHAFNGGAQWCGTGWVKDKDVAYYPMQETGIPGCSGGITSPQLIQHTPGTLAAANCYGIKPSRLENLFTLTNTGIITANKRGRYVRIFNTDKLTSIKERYICLTQVLITDSANTVISTGATAIQYNPTVDWDPAANGYADGARDAGAQKLLQYTTKQTPKAWNLGYRSSSWSDDQFVEIDLGKPFADRKGVIKNIEIVPNSDTGFGQTPDRATGLRVVISDVPYIYPYSNKVGQYAWNQTMLNLADSCGLSSDGTMKYKKTCEIGEGVNARKINVCVTDMTIGCDQICTEGKTLQGKPCAPDRNTVPKSQYGAEADINFEFQMYQIGYLYSGKGVAAKDGAGAENPALNPYHSKNMTAVTVSVYQKCEDEDQSKGSFKALDIGWCWKDAWYGPCPSGYDDWNGVLHVCCTCYRPVSTTYPYSYPVDCTGGDPKPHTTTWYGPDTYDRTYWGISVLGGDPKIHTGIHYGPDKYDRTCSGGLPKPYTAGGDTINKERSNERTFKREWQNRQFTDPVRWAQAQQNVGESITRYFGGIKRATLILSGRSEGVKRKYFGIEALGINHLLAYTKELSKHDNSVGGATYINLIKSYVNSADIKSCDRMRSTLTTLFGVETGIDSQPCFEGGPMLFWKKAADTNGSGACPLADGLPGWTAAAKSTEETGRTFMDHILKHAIIAAPAAYAYKYSTDYKNDIVKLKSGKEWETDATVPMNSESPPKPNYALLSFDARCSITDNAMYEVMSHIGAAVWAGQSVTPYFGGNFSTADDVLEACMRQGDNPNGGVWTLATVVVNGPNRNQTKTFSPPVIGRYVRVRPGTSGGSTLQFRQIVVKDPAGNRIAASRVYATSTLSTYGASNAYNGANNSLYHGAKGGMDSFYNEFWEVDLGTNKNIGSIDYIGRTDCCPDAVNGDRIGGTRISVWPSRIGWDIPVNAFTTIDQDKYTIDRMVQAKVTDGTVKNYSQCVNNADIKGWAQAAALPGDDGNANDTLRRICAPYFKTSVWTPGDTSDDRKGNYKAQIGATNR